MKTNLTVIIPTLSNVKGLKYLLNYFKDKNYQVIVVDNKTSKEKNDFIASLFHCYKDRLIYLPQEKNLGFAGGVNKGAENVGTKWMLILNDDIEFGSQKAKVKRQNLNSKVKSKENPIDQLIQFAEEKKLDAVSPVLRNLDGEVENYGYKVLPYGKVELIKENYSLDPRLRGDDTGRRGDDKTDGLTAACLLIKTSAFKKLGGFDESFFAYLEDVDLFLRMKSTQFGICLDVEVLHNHMTTTKTMGNFKARQDMINWWRLFLKHPDKFKFDWQFVIERLRNVSGFIKASLK
jgi:GT2 family glycosyltransferase